MSCRPFETPVLPRGGVKPFPGEGMGPSPDAPYAAAGTAAPECETI